MEQKSFEQIFDISFLSKNSLLIDERGGQCCDFFLLELVKHFKYSIFQLNDSGMNLKKAFSKYNVSGKINSIYSTKYDSEDIIDDIASQRMLGFNYKSKVCVFRSETATKCDYYDFDLIILIDRLISGFTDKIDGHIKIMKRGNIVKECKYKIHADKIVYFDWD